MTLLFLCYYYTYFTVDKYLLVKKNVFPTRLFILPSASNTILNYFFFPPFAFVIYVWTNLLGTDEVRQLTLSLFRYWFARTKCVIDEDNVRHSNKLPSVHEYEHCRIILETLHYTQRIRVRCRMMYIDDLVFFFFMTYNIIKHIKKNHYSVYLIFIFIYIKTRSAIIIEAMIYLCTSVWKFRPIIIIHP